MCHGSGMTVGAMIRGRVANRTEGGARPLKHAETAHAAMASKESWVPAGLELSHGLSPTTAQYCQQSGTIRRQSSCIKLNL